MKDMGMSTKRLPKIKIKIFFFARVFLYIG